jgi:predicted small lipoprotein YifL
VILIVKPIFDLSRLCAISIAVALAGLLGLLSACGQKGPLYLPAKPQPATPAKPAQPAPGDNAAPASK